MENGQPLHMKSSESDDVFDDEAEESSFLSDEFAS